MTQGSARFFVVDQSLNDAAGHHLPFALAVRDAAEQAGFSSVVATHRDFDPALLGTSGTVIPIFTRPTYHNHAWAFRDPERGGEFAPMRGFPLLDRLTPAWMHRLASRPRLSHSWKRVRAASRRFRSAAQREADWRHERDRALNIQAQSYTRLFAEHRVEDGDHVFHVTMTEFDIVALIRGLLGVSRPIRGTWHILFHFPFLAGRPSSYREQAYIQHDVSKLVRRALASLPGVDLRLYATTDALADQFKRLDLDVRPLPYPVAPSPIVDTPPSSPLRVLVVGGARGEKGFEHLQRLVNELWDDGFADGRLQLLVQSGDPSFSIQLPSRPRTGCDPVVDVAFPLLPGEYRDLLETAHIGLFLYDAERYYARFSAALADFLALGIPVVVPAGSSLSEAISTPVITHHIATGAVTESRGPSSAVGLAASDPQDASRCIREMVQYYDHYRTTAKAFTGSWCNENNAERVVRVLAS